MRCAATWPSKSKLSGNKPIFRKRHWLCRLRLIEQPCCNESNRRIASFNEPRTEWLYPGSATLQRPPPSRRIPLSSCPSIDSCRPWFERCGHDAKYGRASRPASGADCEFDLIDPEFTLAGNTRETYGDGSSALTARSCCPPSFAAAAPSRPITSSSCSLRSPRPNGCCTTMTSRLCSTDGAFGGHATCTRSKRRWPSPVQWLTWTTSRESMTSTATRPATQPCCTSPRPQARSAS